MDQFSSGFRGMSGTKDTPADKPAPVDKASSPWRRLESAGWDPMCKLTKTDSRVLSWILETEYVNEVSQRGYAVAPNLDVLPHPDPIHSSSGN